MSTANGHAAGSSAPPRRTAAELGLQSGRPAGRMVRFDDHVSHQEFSPEVPRRGLRASIASKLKWSTTPAGRRTTFDMA